jgi:hypothetical protein
MNEWEVRLILTHDRPRDRDLSLVDVGHLAAFQETAVLCKTDVGIQGTLPRQSTPTASLESRNHAD